MIGANMVTPLVCRQGRKTALESLCVEPERRDDLATLGELFGRKVLGHAVEIDSTWCWQAGWVTCVLAHEEHSADHRVVRRSSRVRGRPAEKTMWKRFCWPRDQASITLVAARNGAIFRHQDRCSGADLQGFEGMRTKVDEIPRWYRVRVRPEGNAQRVRPPVCWIFSVGGLSNSHFDARGYKGCRQTSRGRCAC